MRIRIGRGMLASSVMLAGLAGSPDGQDIKNGYWERVNQHPSDSIESEVKRAQKHFVAKTAPYSTNLTTVITADCIPDDADPIGVKPTGSAWIGGHYAKVNPSDSIGSEFGGVNPNWMWLDYDMILSVKDRDEYPEGPTTGGSQAPIEHIASIIGKLPAGGSNAPYDARDFDGLTESEWPFCWKETEAGQGGEPPGGGEAPTPIGKPFAAGVFIDGVLGDTTQKLELSAFSAANKNERPETTVLPDHTKQVDPDPKNDGVLSKAGDAIFHTMYAIDSDTWEFMETGPMGGNATPQNYLSVAIKAPGLNLATGAIPSFTQVTVEEHSGDEDDVPFLDPNAGYAVCKGVVGYHFEILVDCDGGDVGKDLFNEDLAIGSACSTQDAATSQGLGAFGEVISGTAGPFVKDPKVQVALFAIQLASSALKVATTETSDIYSPAVSNMAPTSFGGPKLDHGPFCCLKYKRTAYAVGLTALKADGKCRLDGSYVGVVSRAKLRIDLDAVELKQTFLERPPGGGNEEEDDDDDDGEPPGTVTPGGGHRHGGPISPGGVSVPQGSTTGGGSSGAHTFGKSAIRR